MAPRQEVIGVRGGDQPVWWWRMGYAQCTDFGSRAPAGVIIGRALATISSSPRSYSTPETDYHLHCRVFMPRRAMNVSEVPARRLRTAGAPHTPSINRTAGFSANFTFSSAAANASEIGTVAHYSGLAR